MSSLLAGGAKPVAIQRNVHNADRTRRGMVYATTYIVYSLTPHVSSSNSSTMATPRSDKLVRTAPPPHHEMMLKFD